MLQICAREAPGLNLRSLPAFLNDVYSGFPVSPGQCWKSAFKNDGVFRFQSAVHLIFEILPAKKMSVLVFWVITPCGLASRYQHFGTYCLHLHWTSALKMEAVCSFEAYLPTCTHGVKTRKTNIDTALNICDHLHTWRGLYHSMLYELWVGTTWLSKIQSINVHFKIRKTVQRSCSREAKSAAAKLMK
jgi:hypothetical protein